MKPAAWNEGRVLWSPHGRPPTLYCGHCRALLLSGDIADLFTTPKRRTRLCAHCTGLWRAHTTPKEPTDVQL